MLSDQLLWLSPTDLMEFFGYYFTCCIGDDTEGKTRTDLAGLCVAEQTCCGGWVGICWVANMGLGMGDCGELCEWELGEWRPVLTDKLVTCWCCKG